MKILQGRQMSTPRAKLYFLCSISTLPSIFFLLYVTGYGQIGLRYNAEPLVETYYRVLRDNPAAPNLLDGMIGAEIFVDSTHIDPSNRALDYTLSVMNFASPVYSVNSTHQWRPPAHLSMADRSMDFVIAANIIDRFSRPSPLVDELLRVVRKDGYVYLVVPARHIFERERNGSLMSELLRDHDDTGDWTFFNETRGSNHVTNDFLFACLYRNWKVYALLESDDYLKDAFTVVLQKE